MLVNMLHELIVRQWLNRNRCCEPPNSATEENEFLFKREAKGLNLLVVIVYLSTHFKHLQLVLYSIDLWVFSQDITNENVNAPIRWTGLYFVVILSLLLYYVFFFFLSPFLFYLQSTDLSVRYLHVFIVLLLFFILMCVFLITNKRHIISFTI